MLAALVVAVSSPSSWYSLVSQGYPDTPRPTVMAGPTSIISAAATHSDHGQAQDTNQPRAARPSSRPSPRTRCRCPRSRWSWLGSRSACPGHGGRARGGRGVRRQGQRTRCAPRLSDARGRERLGEGRRGQGSAQGGPHGDGSGGCGVRARLYSQSTHYS